jgi:hypothetical protein
MMGSGEPGSTPELHYWSDDGRLPAQYGAGWRGAAAESVTEKMVGKEIKFW